MSQTTSTKDRALSLLGQGCGPEVVASALGVSVSAISQHLSDPEFAAQVAELRFKTLAAHNETDQRIQKIEDMLLERLENVLPYLTDPMKLVAAFTRINAAKRRGAAAPEMLHTQNVVVALTIPSVVINKHTVNNNITVNALNQVVRAGTQDLVTIQSGTMEKLLQTSKQKQLETAVEKLTTRSPNVNESVRPGA